ncbi:MAG: hypothetical protein WC797_04335 [Candidatus Paceibacterota bacterium]
MLRKAISLNEKEISSISPAGSTTDPNAASKDDDDDPITEWEN